jgi:serine protease Do
MLVWMLAISQVACSSSAAAQPSTTQPSTTQPSTTQPSTTQPAATRSAASSLTETIRSAQRKVVKIYGAGGTRGLEAFQTGILISAEGEVLTVLSYVLDTDDLAVVLDDGQTFEAELLGTDPIRELALLKIPLDQTGAAYFDLAGAATARPGDRVLAVSNLYGIAAGNEPVSVLHGVVSASAPLRARRGSFAASYRGNVYVVDAHANNPGAAGGALVDWNGRLLGLLGKELRSQVTGGWLHYALPVDGFAESVASLRTGNSLQGFEDQSSPVRPLTLAELGIALVPDVLARTPPYIDSIRAASSAYQAGLRPDDLVVFVDGTPTATYQEVVSAVGRRENYESIRMGVLRMGEVLEVELSAQTQDRSEDDSGERTEAGGAEAGRADAPREEELPGGAS